MALSDLRQRVRDRSVLIFGLAVPIILMFVFNLFPLPPLDGGRVLVGLLPHGPAMALSRVEPWGFFIVMALIVAGVISNLWMRPLMQLTFGLLGLVLSPLEALLP